MPDWWLRSPEPGDAYNARFVNSDDNNVNNDNVNNQFAVRPDFP